MLFQDLLNAIVHLFVGADAISSGASAIPSGAVKVAPQGNFITPVLYEGSPAGYMINVSGSGCTPRLPQFPADPSLKHRCM